LGGAYGGISIDVASRAADLDSAHFLYDETNGFLALMKMFDRDLNAKLGERTLTHSQWTIRAPMLALTNPDPALGLPPGTTLKPAIFLRNSSAVASSAQVTFHWRSGTAIGKNTVSVSLDPHATSIVDVAALQANGTIPASAQWAYVSIAAPIMPDDLLAVATSFDETGKLGAQTPFTDQASNHWAGGMWEVDPTHDTFKQLGKSAVPVLAAYLSSESPRAQELAMRFLAAIGGDRIVEPLRGFAKHSAFPSNRAEAVMFLVETPLSKALPIIEDVSKTDPDPDVRKTASELFRKYSGTD
jgi:HEAT repeat protein